MFCTKPALCVVLLLCAGLAEAQSEDPKIGINVVLHAPPTGYALAGLALYGQVLDVIPQLNAVTLRANASELAAIRALPYVAAASPDSPRVFASTFALPRSDFAGGANHWPLDAINVTDFGGGRVVEYDGEGVVVAVFDTGLVHNWRDYFPEERIDSVHARAFGGGGGEQGTISSQPDKWEHDTNGHGTLVTSAILGFRYSGTEPLPGIFNGVAPKATIVPIKVGTNNALGSSWSSVGSRAIVYLTDLKLSGAFGSSPVVINESAGGNTLDALGKAAIDYAIANGIVYVSVAHNHGAAGMTYPGAYAPVISVANAGWVREFPLDEASLVGWITRDVAESDASEFFIAPDSGRELPLQDLDVAAPGSFVAVPFSNNGQVDYTLIAGTSIASPHVAGVVALMLQKNPGLTAAEIEQILENTALQLAPGCRTVTFPMAGPGAFPTFTKHHLLSFFEAVVCWDVDATGHGLVQADAALAAVPFP